MVSYLSTSPFETSFCTR